MQTEERPLLPSKFHVPALPAQVAVVPRIQSKLASALGHPLTTVVAPAGFGKTTSVLSWVSQLGGVAVAWYTASPEDAAPDRFWRYLVASLRAADERLAERLDDLAYPDDVESMKATIDQVILGVGEYPGEVVAVIDDLHCVADDAQIAELVGYFVHNLPSNAHVVVTARRLPGMGLAKMRINGELAELGEADLRLGPRESAALFEKAGVALSQSEARDVEDLVHGWPAGCRLVAMLCEGGSHDEVMRALSKVQGPMNDYLFEEVFLDLSAEQRRFLVMTSIVDSFCPSLAAQVTGFDEGRVGAIIDYLLAGNLFIERVERLGEESWYRYQSLLADLLRDRSSHMPARELEAARTRARDWYARHGYLERAVMLSADLRDWEAIRRVIIDNWKSLYMNDEHHVLVRWASAMPEAEILRSPFVCTVLSMPYALKGDVERANSYIMHAVSRLKDDQDFLFAMCMVQKAYLSSFKDDSSSMRLYAQKALAYLPEDEFYLRGMMFQIQAGSYTRADPLRARELFVRAAQMQAAYGNKNLMCSALGNLSISCIELGYLDEALHYAQQAFDLYDPSERDRKPMLHHAVLGMMAVDYERGDFQATLEGFDRFDRLSRQGGIARVRAQALCLRAKALARLGRQQESREALDQALAVSEDGVAGCFPSLGMMRGCHGILHARFANASADEAREWSAPMRLLAAMVAYHAGDSSCYEDLCAEAGRLDPDERNLYIHTLVVAAAFSEREGMTERAQAYLHRAAMHACACDLRSALLENADYLATIARRLAPTCEDATIGGLVGELARAGSRGGGDLDPVRLTERESHVMRLIASGMSMAQVAQEMVVSRETVKKHLANVYAKLGVHSKMQAVALLHERGML